MRLLVDMNLSPDWIPLLQTRGWDAVHWSAVGAPNAPDTDLLHHARETNRVILTQDLDFAQLLFSTTGIGPSVVLLRIANEFDTPACQRVCHAIHVAEESLTKGALLTISSTRIRLRKLPILP